MTFITLNGPNNDLLGYLPKAEVLVWYLFAKLAPTKRNLVLQMMLDVCLALMELCLFVLP